VLYFCKYFAEFDEEQTIFIQLLLSIFFKANKKFITCFLLLLSSLQMKLLLFLGLGFFSLLLLFRLRNFRTWHETCFYIFSRVHMYTYLCMYLIVYTYACTIIHSFITWQRRLSNNNNKFHSPANQRM